ncbi:MAG: MATE family efflux transporter [Synergistota bacterium]|nr:MATE family efflux transporter [Synergistota bacterium]
MTFQRKRELLGNAPIGRALLSLSLPSIAGLVLQTAYNLADTFFLSLWVGHHAVAALAVVFPMQLIIIALAQGIGIGGSSLIATELGAENEKGAEEILGTMTMLISLGSAFIVTLSLAFISPTLSFLGASEQTLPLAKDYGVIVLLGSPMLAFSIMANGIARAEGEAVMAMKTLAISAATNLVLDPIMIRYLDLGVAGAAWATVIAQAGSASWMALYLGGKRSIKIRTRQLKLRRSVATSIISVGSSAFVRQGSASITAVVLNRVLLSMGGDPAVAAMGILNRISTFVTMPLYGLVQGMMPLISHNTGSGNQCRVLRTMDLSALWATAVCLAGAIPLWTFPLATLSPFCSGETLEIAVAAAPYVALGMPLGGFQVVLSGSYQALSRGRDAFLLDLLRRIVLVVPAIYILSRIAGLKGVFMAIPISEVISGGISILLFREVRRCSENRCLVSSQDSM